MLILFTQMMELSMTGEINATQCQHFISKEVFLRDLLWLIFQKQMQLFLHLLIFIYYKTLHCIWIQKVSSRQSQVDEGLRCENMIDDASLCRFRVPQRTFDPLDIGVRKLKHKRFCKYR